MATQQTVKTTIEINKVLIYRAKQKALEEGKSLRDLVQEGLLARLAKPAKIRRHKKMVIGGHGLGGIKDTLRREDIYNDR